MRFVVTVLLFVVCASNVGTDKMNGSSDQESDTLGPNGKTAIDAVKDNDASLVAPLTNPTDDPILTVGSSDQGSIISGPGDSISAKIMNDTDVPPFVTEEQAAVSGQTTGRQVKGDDGERPSDDTSASDTKLEEAVEHSNTTSGSTNTDTVNEQAGNEADASDVSAESDKSDTKPEETVVHSNTTRGSTNTDAVNGQARNEADASDVTTESDKSLMEKGTSIISVNIYDVSEGDDDESTEDSTEEPKGNRAVNLRTCGLSLCSDDVFQLSISPKKKVQEEKERETIELTCQASFKDDSLKAVPVEFEWVFAPAEGPACSFGPSKINCSTALYSFNTKHFLVESAFVAKLNLSNLSPKLTGMFTCLFKAPCCLTEDIVKINATSSMTVYQRPDYSSHLMLAFAIVFSLFIALCLSLYVYFRMARKVRSNMPALDKSGVKYKQIKVLTPPVITMDENMFYRTEHEENRDSYSSFDSTNVKNEADA